MATRATSAADYVRVQLSGGEPEALARLAKAGGVSRQAVIRGLIALANTDSDLLRRAVATQAIADDDRTPGRQRGYTPEDYQAALDAEGSIQGAARALGVHRRTVDQMVTTHRLRVRRKRRPPASRG